MMCKIRTASNGFLIALLLLTVILFGAGNSSALNFKADTLTGSTYSFADGDRSASADFDFTGDDLTLTLTNTYPGDVADPIHLLQAIFFDLTGNRALNPTGASLGLGSTVLYGPDGGGNVGGEFAYSYSLTGAPNNSHQGVSGVGYGLFGPGDLFPGPNLSGPVNPGGMNYGLVSSGYAAGGNAAVTGQFPLIYNSVAFSFTGADGLTIGDIGNLSFEYGTDIARTPEPSSLALLGYGVAGFLLMRKRVGS